HPPSSSHRIANYHVETVRELTALPSTASGILDTYERRLTMPSPFPGFPPEALQFFRGLARNNRREWFLPRKPVFEEKVKEPMRQLVDALNIALHDFAPEFETDPDKAIFRIYRDIRFSKDKKPYKEHIAATFHRRGAMGHGQGGYYVAISHKEVA